MAGELELLVLDTPLLGGAAQEPGDVNANEPVVLDRHKPLQLINDLQLTVRVSQENHERGR